MKFYKLMDETKIKLVLAGDVQLIKDIKRKIKEYYKIESNCTITITYNVPTNISIVNLCSTNIIPCEIDL